MIQVEEMRVTVSGQQDWEIGRGRASGTETSEHISKLM